MNTSKIIIAVTAILALLVVVAPAAALHTYWQHDPATPGDWFDPLNWDNGIPTIDDYAHVGNGGTAQIFADAESRDIYAGYNSAVEQFSGTNTLDYCLYLGCNSDSTGTYNLTGGGLSARYEYIGRYGTGAFSQTGGTHTIESFLSIGRYSGSSGTYNLSAGELSVVTTEYIGYEGAGVFNQTGGTNTVDNNLYLGHEFGPSGEYNFSGGSLAVGSLYINNGWMDIDISEIDAFTVSGDKVTLLDGYILDGKIFDSTLCPDGYLYAVYDPDNDWTTLEAIPEPGTLLLLAPGLFGIVGLLRRKFQ